MASNENNDMNLVELDLEVFEIDGALLRELLEEEEGKGENDLGNVEYMVESKKENNANPDLMDTEQQHQQEQDKILEKCECHSANDFEWLNMMDLMEPTNALNDVRNFSDDIVGMVDFGYANEEFYSQICGGLGSNEANYGCLWEDYDEFSY